MLRKHAHESLNVWDGVADNNATDSVGKVAEIPFIAAIYLHGTRHWQFEMTMA
jgi:hypothetical protein